MVNRTILVDEEVYELLDACREEYIESNPVLKKMPKAVSKNKIIYVIAKFYLKH